MNLSVTGDARPNFVATGLRGTIALKVAHQQRPRPDQTHVTNGNIPEFWQLVETRLPKNPAERRQALTVRFHPSGPIRSHRSELDQTKWFPSKPRPLLRKQYRPPHE